MKNLVKSHLCLNISNFYCLPLIISHIYFLTINAFILSAEEISFILKNSDCHTSYQKLCEI